MSMPLLAGATASMDNAAHRNVIASPSVRRGLRCISKAIAIQVYFVSTDRASIGHNRWFIRVSLQVAQPVGNRLAGPDGIVMGQIVTRPRMYSVSCSPTSRYARGADRIDQPVRLL